MTNRASGTFEVKVSPLESEGTFGRMSLDKQFQGDLAATGKGTMLTAGTSVNGSAAYVAIEQVQGTLHGRDGSFVLQHNGTMTRGTAEMSVKVVPDSGTGQLAGLSGRMTIVVAGGNHSYEFEYTLAEPAAPNQKG